MPSKPRSSSSTSRRPAGTGYATLITVDRLRPSEITGRDLEAEILSDYTRIITSTGFRRLQAKAQVFSLEENAAVRTRLTHTLEVAMYGGLIAKNVFESLRQKERIDEALRLPFIQTVQNACLLHDIGNPPFGHLGEFAIRAWFVDHKSDITGFWKRCEIPSPQIERHYRAFEYFDGNGQGLRIVSRLQWLRDEYGLNLSRTLLASIVKYLSSKPLTGEPFTDKAGFFETERQRVLTAWRALGLKADSERPLQRHPLTFLMEAADDISYCLSDIEDAIEKDILSEQEFLVIVPEQLSRFKLDARSGRKPLARDSHFVSFRINLSRYLVTAASKAFVDNEHDILAGSYHKHVLLDDSLADFTLQWLRTYAKNEIFPSREAVNIELSGHEVIQRILQHYLGRFRNRPSEGPDETEIRSPFDRATARFFVAGKAQNRVSVRRESYSRP